MSANENISELDKVLSQFSVFGRYHFFFMFWSFLALASNAVFCSNYIFAAEEVAYRCKDQDFGNDTCTSVTNASEKCSEWVYENPHSFVAEFGLACQDWKRTLVGTIHSFGYMVGLLFVGPMSDRLSNLRNLINEDSKDYDNLYKMALIDPETRKQSFYALQLYRVTLYTPANFLQQQTKAALDFEVAMKTITPQLSKVTEYLALLGIVYPCKENKLGRKLSIVITGMLGGVIGLARSFTSHYWLYIALEFLEGAIGDSCSPMFILTIEIVSSKNRMLYYILCSFGYPFGGILVSLAAWKFMYWRTFLRVIYIPALLFFVYLYVIDESPRWLLIKGKKDKAVEIIKKAAEKNKLKIDSSSLEKIECEKEKKVKFSNLLKMTFESKIILKRFLICLVWWTTSTFVSYGLSINSVSLKGNKYVNFALTSLMDIPASFVVLISQNYFKRKTPLITSFLVGALLCLAQPFLPENLSWVSLVMYMASKLMSSFYFAITYMFTSELFPTYTRNSMHALCSSLGRVGSMIAPQTPLLMQYWFGLPSLVFGGISLIAGLITFLVPDTADDSLPDTVQQAEEIGKSKEEEQKKPAALDFVIAKEKDCSRL